MQLNLDLIETPSALAKLAESLKREKIIAIDTEFVREKTFVPNLALIQIANREEIWLVDAPAFKKTQIAPLLNLLQNPDILKVLHSAYGDQECFYSTYKITVTPTLDTFEAASLLGLGESVGLRELIRKTLNISIPKFLTRTDWLKRPISQEMKRYAMTDVEYLLPVADNMIAQLNTMGRKEWAFELSSALESPKLYSNNPEELARRLAKSGRVKETNFHLFQELVSWRESRARELDLPRRRIADDETLINIAHSRPKTIQELGKFRGLNPGEVRKQGDRILQILQKDYSLDKIKAPAPHKILRPTSVQARTIDFLSTYLKAICQDKKIASRLIMTVKDLTKIVVENILDPEKWVEAGICSRRAMELVGEPLTEVLLGKRALALREGKLQILEI